MTTPDPQKPDSPFKLNSARITILVLVVLAIVMIVGAINGGVSNYQQLREATQDQQLQGQPAPAEPAPAAPTN